MNVEMLRLPGPRYSSDVHFRARDIHPTAVRIPPTLKEHLEAAAIANCRSTHAEILARLEDSTVGEFIDEHGEIVSRFACLGK